jgi:hypothetical protein
MGPASADPISNCHALPHNTYWQVKLMLTNCTEHPLELQV